MTTAIGPASAATDALLVPSTGAGLGDEPLADKLGACGGTPFRLERLDRTNLSHSLFVPPAALKALRRARLVAALEALLDRGPVREVRDASVVAEVRERLRAAAARMASSAPAGARRASSRCAGPTPSSTRRWPRAATRSSSTGWSWSGSATPSSAPERPARA
ncbi:MAG: DUF3656 domain-containing protein [Myxococcota bacterium]